MSGEFGNYITGKCPDKKCEKKIYFHSEDKDIYCIFCGQVLDPNQVERKINCQSIEGKLQIACRYNISRRIYRKSAQTIKVKGLSNFHAKLVSPFLTLYGMDKKTSQAKKLSELNNGKYFDCSVLGNRAFLIEPELLSIHGYGRDLSGSQTYLAEMLNAIKEFNSGLENLIPIHSDGDGHCLVHAISRCLVGREIFWHPLRCHLKRHFEENVSRYKEILKDIFDDNEWQKVIDECDPEYIPTGGETMGLRTFHIFGLANVLKRPIILLDSLAGFRSLNEYTGVYLPVLCNPSECSNKAGVLNKPLCIAWNCKVRNHYVPLVALNKGPLPRIPKSLLPKAWGVPQALISEYIEFGADGACEIGGTQSIVESYLLKLVEAMDSVFFEHHGFHPLTAVDYYHAYQMQPTIVDLTPADIIERVKTAMRNNCLFRCILCNSICELPIKAERLKPGGSLYSKILSKTSILFDGLLIPLYDEDLTFKYNESDHSFSIENYHASCSVCQTKNLRRILAEDNSVKYIDKDTVSEDSKSCPCGYKHFWDKGICDSLPKTIELNVQWNKVSITESIYWFENSNAFDIADSLTEKYCPGIFGNDHLKRKLVDQIFDKSVTAPSVSHPTLGYLHLTMPNIHCLFPLKNEAEEAESQELTYPSNLAPFSDSDFIKPSLPKSVPRNSSKSETLFKPKKVTPTVDKPTIIAPTVRKPTFLDPALEKPTIISEMDTFDKMESKQKTVKVVTDDGRHAKLVISNENFNYTDLQEWITKEFNIEPQEQRISIGFPPQHLKPSNMMLELKNGDRLTVKRIQPTDELDKILNLTKQAADKSGLTLWKYVKKQPSNFQKDGLFYEFAKRDGVLKHGKHIKLSMFKEHKFRYNEQKDILELCLDCNFHIPIDQNLDDTISQCMATKKKVNDPPSGRHIRYGPGCSVLSGTKMSSSDLNKKAMELLFGKFKESPDNDNMTK